MALNVFVPYTLIEAEEINENFAQTALKDAANTFTQQQKIEGTGGDFGLEIKTTGTVGSHFPALILNNSEYGTSFFSTRAGHGIPSVAGFYTAAPNGFSVLGPNGGMLSIEQDGTIHAQGDVIFDNPAEGPVLRDRTTNDLYRLYVNNGVLGIEAV
jgi:hypothetical protein